MSEPVNNRISRKGLRSFDDTTDIYWMYYHHGWSCSHATWEIVITKPEPLYPRMTAVYTYGTLAEAHAYAENVAREYGWYILC